jgi:peptidoglycan hydrolase-like protein with peptidoglycan-binding domain
METLAYLHLALAYEEPANLQPTSIDNDLEFFKPLNWKKLSDKALVGWLPLAIALIFLGTANHALAQRLGDTGAEVISLQTSLSQAGFYNGPIDGVFGPATEDAIRQFQSQQGLEPDGIVGPATRSLLLGQGVSSQSYAPGSGSLLQLGARGPAVTELQTQLQNTGYFPGAIDGVFGPTTEDAVKQFQVARGLIPDGVVGQETQQALVSNQPGRNQIPPLPSFDNTLNQGSARTTLQQGDRGAAVTELQTRLRDLGFYNGGIDGVFGSTTADALRQFQSANGLVPDGVVGAETQIALKNPITRSNANYALYNTNQQGDRIVLGRPANFRYVVVVPSQNANTLSAVRRFVPDAFLADSRLGPYVQAGAFPSRAGAESLSKALQARGLAARVVYF